MADQRNSTIYGLEATDEPGRIRYVGRTTKRYLCSRLVGHRYDAKTRQSAVCEWIRSVVARGADITGTVLQADAPVEAEAEWIERLRGAGLVLENIRGGGKGGGAFDGESRRRLSASNRRAYLASGNNRNRGEAAPNARLTEADVREIRRAYAAGGTTQRALAVRFRVGRTTVGKVLGRQLWGHV